MISIIKLNWRPGGKFAGDKKMGGVIDTAGVAIQRVLEQAEEIVKQEIS